MALEAQENPFPYVTVAESANDGSEIAANPAADFRKLFLGEDGQLHLKDSAGAVTDLATALTDHTHAVTGSGATGGGATLAPTKLTLPTAMGTGEGEVEYDTSADVLNVYDGQRERAVSHVGWATSAFPLVYDSGLAFATAVTLAAAGGSIAMPMLVPTHMLLDSVVIRSTDTGTQRTWGWDLYLNRLNNGNSGENTAARIVACTANETFTPSAASFRFLAASAATYLAPGVYWLVVQNRHATNNFGFGTTAQNAASVGSAEVTYQTKTTTNPNGATLDLVAATWTKGTAIVGCALRGRVLGMGAPI